MPEPPRGWPVFLRSENCLQNTSEQGRGIILSAHQNFSPKRKLEYSAKIFLVHIDSADFRSFISTDDEYFLQSFHGSVEKGHFSAFFRFLKQKGGVVRNGPLLYFSRHPLPFLDAAKKRKSNVFECSASPTPRDPKRMVFSHDFCIGICAYLVGREGEISGESRGSSGDWI
jgi:hypothetical protein